MQTVIMRLFHTVDAFGGTASNIAVITVRIIAALIAIFTTLLFRLNGARLIVGYLSKANRSNVFQFAVMSTMSYNLVRVRANEIALQAMEM